MPTQAVVRLVAAVILVGSGAAFAVQPTPTTTAATTAEQRKQDLEIQKLEREVGPRGTLHAWLPVLTSTAAVFGAGFGFFRYLRERRDERTLRVKQGLESNIERLVDFAKNEHQALSSVKGSLNSLRRLCEELAHEERSTEDQRITEVIVASVEDDIDFDDPKQAGFELVCLMGWQPYKHFLSDHRERHEFVMYRYQRALMTLRDKDPDYFANIQLAEDGSFAVGRYTNEIQYRHFQRLLGGYRRHVEMLDGLSRELAISDLAEALGNPALAARLFHTPPAT